MYYHLIIYANADMGQFLAKMEEKAATTVKIKNKFTGLKPSKSDNLSDLELSKMALTRKLPQVIYTLSPPLFCSFTLGNAKAQP